MRARVTSLLLWGSCLGALAAPAPAPARGSVASARISLRSMARPAHQPASRATYSIGHQFRAAIADRERLRVTGQLVRDVGTHLAAEHRALIPSRPAPGTPPVYGAITIHPRTGAGAYLIQGGLNGGFLVTTGFNSPIKGVLTGYTDIARLARCGSGSERVVATADATRLAIILDRLPAGQCVAAPEVLALGDLGICRHEYRDQEGVSKTTLGSPCVLGAGDQAGPGQPCAQSDLGMQINVVVFLNGRPTWKHLFDLGESMADRGTFNAWLNSLELGPDGQRIIRNEHGLGYATDFTVDPAGAQLTFDYVLDADPRLPTHGTWTVVAYPHIQGNALLVENHIDPESLRCRLSRSQHGRYTFLRYFRTFAPAGQPTYHGVGPDDGRYSHTGPLELSVPTPGGPLAFQRFYNSADTDFFNTTGPGWSHTHRWRAFDASSGHVILVDHRGQGMKFRPAQQAGEYLPTPGARGRLQRAHCVPPPRPGLDDADACRPPRRGYLYTTPDGTQHHFALARERGHQRPPPDGQDWCPDPDHCVRDGYGRIRQPPPVPKELLLTRVRDLAGNGFDYIYDRDTWRLAEVQAITQDRPGHYALRFTYERPTIELDRVQIQWCDKNIQ